MPGNPRGWLIKASSRRPAAAPRGEEARWRREERAAALTPRDAFTAPPPGDRAPRADDTLSLLFLCCHPELTPPAQIALTLRAVGGLTTAEIARAYLVPEATMAQRISRAKQKVRGVRFGRPERWEQRLPSVLQTLYLIFNEGYTATSGAALQRRDLAGEAIRLARAVHALLPDDGEVAGLLALMLLTEARRDARSGPHGELIPLDEQDRDRRDRAAIDEGVALLTGPCPRAGPGRTGCGPLSPPYTTRPSAEATDWAEILGLYDALVALVPGPVERLNRALAVAMVHGPRTGLAELDALTGELRGHRLEAVRGHLLERAGDPQRARAVNESAAAQALSLPERRYLRARAARSKD